MEFINDNFLLESETVHELYQEHAQDQPIIDYRCHSCPFQHLRVSILD